MLGDTAVAVHPEDERFRHLVGKMIRLPVVGRLIPIIADEYSDMEKGSGAVKITPAHDFNDFEVGRRHDLEMINILTAEAKLNENTPDDWHGMDRFDARKRIVAEFEKLGLLADVTEILHTVPHGDRSGIPVEPWLMDQWYVDAHTLAQPAIKAVEDGRTRIVPQRWEKTYFDWMRNIQPWCISRQLWWGHRIPAWYGPDGTPFVAMDEAAALKQAQAHYGEDVSITQDDDVLDTWFSSGLWPFSTLDWPEDNAEIKRYYPGNVLVTGFDIIFFWVARMMMMGMHFMDGQVPFRDVYIHALVRDEKGQKMSKSKGNVLDPLELSDKYGADALRFTLTAMAAQGRDIKLAESRIEGYRNFATKIWNACRFLEMNGCITDADIDLTTAKDPVNQWIVASLAETAEKVGKAIEEYRFNEAADSVYKFIWHSYCDWYLELIKPQLGEGQDSSSPPEAHRIAPKVLAEAIRLLHPIMPFITEELWKKVFAGNDMLITASWPEPLSVDHAEAAAEIGFVIDLVTAIRSIRNEMNVPASAELELVLKAGHDGLEDKIKRNYDAIERLARISAIRIAGKLPEQSALGVVNGIEFALPLEGILDFDAERVRLQKEISLVEKEMAKIEGKLSNPGFLAKAPEDVVEENRQRLADETDTKERLAVALERLS
jgi:valyl-tRNA synthetase